MKTKATLSLLEQCVMLLVFALAAALCLKGFLWAGQTARDNADRDGAVLCAQNAAEAFKHGDMAACCTLFFDDDWMPAEAPAAFALTVTPEQSAPGLEQVTVTVTGRGGDVLITLPVARQEVDRP